MEKMKCVMLHHLHVPAACVIKIFFSKKGELYKKVTFFPLLAIMK